MPNRLINAEFDVGTYPLMSRIKRHCAADISPRSAKRLRKRQRHLHNAHDALAQLGERVVQPHSCASLRAHARCTALSPRISANLRDKLWRNAPARLFVMEAGPSPHCALARSSLCGVVASASTRRGPAQSAKIGASHRTGGRGCPWTRFFHSSSVRRVNRGSKVSW